jgi:hypothetical protein|tara:strand:+ start:276 stop:680 length:405 start_codon:yes stop_codon:yes gene_type:complete
MTTIIIILVIVGFFFVIASLRKGSSVVKKKPRKLNSFTSELPPDKIFKLVAQLPQRSKYKIDNIDETNMTIIISSSASAMSYGFFFPVYITQQTDGKTLVEVGIKGKIPQYGPVVTKNLDNIVNELKAVIISNE